MNFAAFQLFRENLLRERKDVSDCAETNLYRALTQLIPAPGAAPQCPVHRCHLASEWVERFGFSPEASRRALISCGVRDSLSRLFRHGAAAKAALWIPEDNYPVYGELARAAGLVPKEFPTLPAEWPDTPPAPGPEWLLVTNPLKPAGHFLTAADVNSLVRWLSASASRRLLLDAVYTFDTRFHAGTLQLQETGQTILLHSLTKGWLHPRLFGIALVPETDTATLTPVFRDDPPPQENLARARELMETHAAMPALVSRALASAMRLLRDSLQFPVPPPLSTEAPGYFLTVAYPWRELLETYRLLGIPATVFGSRREDITLLSSLTFCS